MILRLRMLSDENDNFVFEASAKLPKGYIAGTVGAGDAFCAGVAVGLTYGKSMEEAITIGDLQNVDGFARQQGQQNGQQAAEYQVEDTGVEQGPDQALLDELLTGPDQLIDADDPGKGSVLDQGDDLVAHGGSDPLDDLQQHHLKKDLPFGHTQHLTGFILTLWYAFNTASVNLGKIAGIVDGKGHNGGGKTGHSRKIKDQTRSIEDDNQLEHQRCTANNPHKAPHYGFQWSKLAHGAETDYKAQRDGKQQCQTEDLQALPKAF